MASGSGGSKPTSTAEASSCTESSLKRSSGDAGWNYGTLCDPTNKDAKKEENRIREEEIWAEVEIENEENEVIVGTKRKKASTLGPMDKFANPINPDAPTMHQQNIVDAICKERTHQVHQYCARWVYESGIPFHAIDLPGFKKFVEAVGQYGPGYRSPSQYQLREPLLKEEVERTKGLLKNQEEEWAQNGCSVMTDGWTDKKRRSIMNFCVNSRVGTTFLSSVECSKDAHTGAYIFDYVDKCIEKVGPQNVIQVVTDNASNNMAAAQLLIEKRPNMFWTSCAAHTIDLMLEAIGKEAKFKGLIAKAKTLTIYIYAHHRTLAMMRRFTKSRDIVRPGVTRFATSFLTLQSLMEKKEKLRLMFTSDDWTQSNWAKTNKGKGAYAIVMSVSFWNGISLCLKVISPLVKVLRLVDGDRKPSMGFLYGELMQAKEDVKMAYYNVEVNYRPILDIIETKAKGRLDGPLHMAGYLLNPYYFFKDPTIKDYLTISDAVFTCVEKLFVGEFEKQDLVINVELPKYKRKERDFGRMLAAKGCSENNSTYDPVTWWMTYGNATPTLQKMAIKILSLTTSSSGCERNWSAFEGIHTKKRNQLDSQRLNDLVFIQFNAKLINKWTRVKNQNMDVLRSLDASKAQSWIVAISDEEEEEMEEGGSLEARELHEDDFESDEEPQVEGGEEFEFNSDDETLFDIIDDDN